MPIKQRRKTQPKRSKRRPAPYMQNAPRPQSNASTSIVRGLSGIANQFMPGAGLAVTGVSKLLGFGAYSTADAERILASKVPEMHATLDRGVRIAHHEYLGDVLSTTAFTALKYPINPGQPSSFPWLSTVAAAFQEYELNGCIFFFKSTSANALNSINTALGQVIGGVQYNPYQTAPASKIEMLALAGASDGKPSESNIYPVECKSDMTLMRSKLVRLGSVSDDLAKYDHGNFYLGTNGSQATATVGELHIVYDVWLKKPRLWPALAGTAWYAHLYSEGPAALFPLGNPAGTLTSVVNNLGVSVDRVTRKITIPANNVVGGTVYKLTMVWSGDTAATVVPPVLAYANAAEYATTHYKNIVTGSYWCPPAGDLDNLILEKTFKVTQGNTDVSIAFGNAGVFPTVNSIVDIVLTEAGDP